MNSITFFLSFIPILALILLSLNLIFAPHNPYQEKSSTFECGFHSFLGQNRTQFNISFFVFGLLFLTFDLELVMALPGLISIYNISVYGLCIMLIFFTILTIGFAFELGKKALSIDSRQYNHTLESSFSINYTLQYIVLYIRISFIKYIEKFNIIRLFKGFIKLKITTLCLASCLYLLNIIYINNIWIVSSNLVLLFIIYKFLFMPWKNNNIIIFFITITFNSFIISFIFILAILVLNADINIWNMILSFSIYILHNETFGVDIISMDDGSNAGPSGGPNNNPNNNPNGGGPNNGPQGPAPFQPQKNSGSEEKPYPSFEEVKRAKDKAEFSEKMDEIARVNWEQAKEYHKSKYDEYKQREEEWHEAESKQRELEDDCEHPDHIDKAREETNSKYDTFKQAEKIMKESGDCAEYWDKQYAGWHYRSGQDRGTADDLEFGPSPEHSGSSDEESYTEDPEEESWTKNPNEESDSEESDSEDSENPEEDPDSESMDTKED